jgi:hypothetical protein
MRHRLPPTLDRKPAEFSRHRRLRQSRIRQPGRDLSHPRVKYGIKPTLSQQPERVASLTVLCPAVLDTRTLARIGERLLVVTGDRGPGARRVQAGLPDLPRATAVVLDDYGGLTWSDIAAERGDGLR